MRKRKKIDSSKVILTSIIVFFTVILFLSLPVLFNYNSIQNVIEKKVYSEFKLDLKILGDISIKIFPKPHYLVKKANLDLDIINDDSSTIEVQNLKLFIPSQKLYSRSDIVIEAVEIENANIYLKTKDILDLRYHLYYKINKPIYIKNSKFFILDNNEKTILISPIKKISYFINNKSKSKELKIKGNIFDIDYNSNWKRYYAKPKNTLHEIKLKNPNILIKNLFFFEDFSNFKGETFLNFLNEEIFINYSVKENEIYIESPNQNKKQTIELNSKIKLNPFFFDATINIEKKDMDFIIDDLISIILNSKDEYLENINGNLTFVLNNLKNSIIDYGEINFSIRENSVKLKNSTFEIKDIGKITSNFRYYLDEGDLIFSSENIFEIVNKKEFSRKFQLSLKKLNNINKIYFNLEKNIDNNEIFISDIYINKVENEKTSENYYKIKNLQVLKNLVRDILP
tara:strand:+ start:77 stop:1444 length:1368 start_codon:yes stop_codon:yes gene_type:complete